MEQQELFSALIDIYSSAEHPLSNSDVYKKVSAKIGLIDDERNFQPVGKDKTMRNLYHRKIRWLQQTLKSKKILKRVERGFWEMLPNEKIRLRSIKEGKKVIAFSTNFGVCLWASNKDVFKDVIDEPIHLVLTSPPYPLKVSRAYGNVDLKDYIDFICQALEPIVKKMANGASIALNVSNDIFVKGSPARSTYLERLIIALEDRLSLFKMDTLQWVSNKPPGPIAWASKKRTQLNTGYEPVLWFCNDPLACFSDNRRVLLPHTKEHQKFINNGGVKKSHTNGDGAYRKFTGAFSNKTKGKIPRNVLTFNNFCSEGRSVTKYAKEIGILPHSAKMPLKLASFLVQFLTRPGDLVVDPFAGTLTTAQAAEENQRRWVCTEIMWEYIRQSFVRFKGDVWINPNFANV